MKHLMEGLRLLPPAEVGGLYVLNMVDYATAVDMPIHGGNGSNTPQKLPQANVLELQLEGGHKLIIRPSGTEPKVKAYTFVKGENPQQAQELLERIESAARELLA